MTPFAQHKRFSLGGGTPLLLAGALALWVGGRMMPPGLPAEGLLWVGLGLIGLGALLPWVQVREVSLPWLGYPWAGLLLGLGAALWMTSRFVEADALSWGALFCLIIGLPWKRTEGDADNGRAGLGLGLSLAAAMAGYLVLAQLPWGADLAHRPDTSPSPETQAALEQLTEPVEAVGFFSPVSQQGSQAMAYLDQAGAVSPRLKVRRVDAVALPQEAQRLAGGPLANGVVVVAARGSHQRLWIGEGDQAQSALSRMDLDFRGALEKVSRPRGELGFTSGHGEWPLRRGSPRQPGEPDLSQERSLVGLEMLAQHWNLSLQELEPGELNALPQKNPALLVILDPTARFTPGEQQALDRYLAQGGRVLLALSPVTPPRPGGMSATDSRPGTAQPLAGWLAGMGLVYSPAPLAHSRLFAQQTFQAADHGRLVTVNFPPHPAMTLLRGDPNRFPVVAQASGSFHWKAAGSSDHPAAHIQGLLSAMPGTWAETAGADWTQDPRFEPAGDFWLAATLAFHRKEINPRGFNPVEQRKNTPSGETFGGRLVAVGDPHIIAGALLENEGNRALFTQVMNWLLEGTPYGRPLPRPIPSGDVPVIHRQDQDWLWFYLPVFLAPLAWLALGRWWNRGEG
ncbi:MAG: GldG family protein [Deltaproteobacteria bacterium]|nr:GldG family protein [Deltaproteobacteria bacterium]